MGLALLRLEWGTFHGVISIVITAWSLVDLAKLI
jgi:hypothetical protein